MNNSTKSEIVSRLKDQFFSDLVKYEQERKKILVKMLVTELILLLIVLGYVRYMVFVGQLPVFWSRIITVSAGLAFLYMIANPIVEKELFEENLNLEFMWKALKAFKNIRHSKNKSVISEGDIKQSTLFSIYNRIEVDDSFVGNHAGVKFRIQETELQWHGSKGRVATPFNGVIISFNSNKTIREQTIITTANDFETKHKIPMGLVILFGVMLSMMCFAFSPLFGLLQDGRWEIFFGAALVTLPQLLFVFGIMVGVFIYIKKKYSGNVVASKNKIKLEDVKFGKRFKVYSNDELEARYLVTTAFMERFLNLTTAFGTNKVKCAFFDDKIMFAISTRKNLFEFGSLYKPLTNPENIGFFNELTSILDMIEYFKLDEKTGL